MTNPDDLSMATLLAEDGMPMSAGLPESLRRDLEHLNALRKRSEQAKAKRERVEQLLARIEELQKELKDVMREYLDATTDTPAA